MIIRGAAGTVVQDTASALFGVEGLRVIEADAEADGTLTVWVATDHPGAAACPDCGPARDGCTSTC